ncbi:MAG: tRNA glutamyl-Q(34) synthetase GluQRS [Acidimicrobiia bacterium]|jgi:glutamyl-tRNA synthetase
MATGRFAPTPSADLHVGNLRTALLAWLFARSAGSRFLVRVEDLDPRPGSRAVAERQLADLRALGLDWDGPVTYQSDHRARHEEALAALVSAGLTFPCYCTRREVREAAAAPHAPTGAYPGTCRDLTARERAAHEAAGRPAALRLRSDGRAVTVHDRLRGPVTAVVDDIVLRRNDGVPAYHLAVVVDDHDQGVEEVVRGDDLLEATPSQAHLCDRLGLPRPTWAHVPLVLGPDGRRLAKRHGAVTLADLAVEGLGAADVLLRLAASLGLSEPGVPPVLDDLVARFDPDRLPREPWVFDSAGQTPVEEGPGP